MLQLELVRFAFFAIRCLSHICMYVRCSLFCTCKCVCSSCICMCVFSFRYGST